MSASADSASNPSDGLESAGLGQGQVIDGYAVEKLISKGAAGFIFSALAPESQTRVALKLLRPNHLGDKAYLKRFDQEIKLLERVDHPNLVRFVASGRYHNLPYYCMEFVAGQDLDKVLRHRGRAPLRWSLQLASVLSRAVSHLHRKGVVHRDIKPQNILVEDGSERPVLTDLGVAKQVEGLAESWDGVFRGAGSVTRLGEVVGTPAYMAPEQLDPKSRKIGPRTDIYGLGAVLYTLILGLPPFEAQNLYELLRAVQSEAPLPLREVRASIPAELDRLVLSCLAKAPEERPGSALELARALEALLSELPEEEGNPHYAAPWVPGKPEEDEAGEATPDGAPRELDSSPLASAETKDFGPFELVEELDRDATGILTRARRKGQSRNCLLKRAHSARYSVLERFRRETQALAAIQHPNIMPVLQAGDVEGVPWFTMDLPSGDHLSQYLSSGRRPPLDKSLLILKKLASALGYMHSKGMVHRNLSPRVVYLTADSEPRLTGFTAVGALGGTTLAGDPDYRSPEQGAGEPADPSVDLYSLAAIGAELLTGRSLQSLRAEGAALSQALAEIPAAPRAALLRALDADPRLRFNSAEEFEAALEKAPSSATWKRMTGRISRLFGVGD